MTLMFALIYGYPSSIRPIRAKGYADLLVRMTFIEYPPLRVVLALDSTTVG